MKLIGSLTSPCVRRIRVMLLEKGLPFDFVNDPPWEANTHVADYNPLGKVPALVTDEGDVLFDSLMLAEYLELKRVSPHFLPNERAAALPVLHTAMLVDGVNDAAVAILLESRRPPEKQVADWVARQQGKIDRGLAALEAQLANKQFLCGEDMSLADIFFACLAGFLDFRMPNYDWRAHSPALARLNERLQARYSFRQTVPIA